MAETRPGLPDLPDGYFWRIKERHQLGIHFVYIQLRRRLGPWALNTSVLVEKTLAAPKDDTTARVSTSNAAWRLHLKREKRLGDGRATVGDLLGDHPR